MLAAAARAWDSFFHSFTPLVKDLWRARTSVTSRTVTISHCGLITLSMTPTVTPAARPGFSIMTTS